MQFARKTPAVQSLLTELELDTDQNSKGTLTSLTFLPSLSAPLTLDATTTATVCVAQPHPDVLCFPDFTHLQGAPEVLLRV